MVHNRIVVGLHFEAGIGCGCGYEEPQIVDVGPLDEVRPKLTDCCAGLICCLSYWVQK